MAAALAAALAASALALIAAIGIAALSNPSPRKPAMASLRTDRTHREPPWGHRELWLGPMLVWLLLLVLLAGSAWSAFLPLGALNPTVNLLIAAVMLFLLAAVLMDLKRASAVLRLVAAAGLLWMVFFFTMTFTDYLSRRPTLPARVALSPQPDAPTGFRDQARP